MEDRQAETKRPGPSRLRTIEPAPKAPCWNGEAEALGKVGGELGLVLWKALRRVRLWAETEPEQRPDMFPPATREIQELMAVATTQAPELVEAIGVFAALLRTPERVDGRQVGEACSQVYQWADAQGFSRVAMYFAEAAAAAEPASPARAVDAGWMCRRVAEGDLLERSVAWYDRAFGLAVRAKDRQEVLRALTGYGALMKDMGRHENARVLYERAALRAARTGRLRQAAVAQHYLLGLAAESGSYLQGERYARKALEQYPIHDARIPHLAHDYAFLLIRNRYYSLALPLLEKLLQVVSRPDDRLLVNSSIARCAGGCGRKERFEEARRHVLQLIGNTEEFAPAALVNLAEGARAFGDWTQAGRSAKLALEMARSRKDAEPERVALEVLRNIAGREPLPREAEPEHRQRIENLIRRFMVRLRKAPGQHQPGADPKTVPESVVTG